MEFVAKTFVNIIPSRARRSRCGVWLTCDPYAPIACAAWSSDMMYRMFGRSALRTGTATAAIRTRARATLRIGRYPPYSSGAHHSLAGSRVFVRDQPLPPPCPSDDAREKKSVASTSFTLIPAKCTGRRRALECLPYSIRLVGTRIEPQCLLDLRARFRHPAEVRLSAGEADVSCDVA